MLAWKEMEIEISGPMLPAWMTTAKPLSLPVLCTWPAKKELTTVSFAELSEYCGYIRHADGSVTGHVYRFTDDV